MRKGIARLAAVALLAAGGLTACSGNGAVRKPKIGVILPDSATSNRWETADRKYLDAAFRRAGVDSVIQNAQGDKNAFQTLADQMITEGVTVLMITNLDSGTGKAVLDNARSKGVATIDYDRLTLDGGADYYVSFDNTLVGRLQGEGLVRCLTERNAQSPLVAELNGAPTDNNATDFKQGYDSVLQPRFDANEYRKGPDQPVPGWDNTTAGTIFEQMLTQTRGDIDGVIAANDGLANAVISVLRKNHLNGTVPVTGQDATVEGLQNVMVGDQCMTVYKAVRAEADAAAELAVGLAKGQRKSTGQTIKDKQSGADVPALLLQPKIIYPENVKDVVADGYVSTDDLCTGTFAELCTKFGVS